MAGSNATPSQQLWRTLDHARRENNVSPGELVGLVAALLLLRWADVKEADDEAIASFDGSAYAPALALPARWRSWCSLRGGKLQRTLTDLLPHALAEANRSKLTIRLRRVEPVLATAGRISCADLDALVQLVADLPFETPFDRAAAGDVLEGLANGDVSTRVFGTGKLSTAWAWHLHGELSTPALISQLIVELASPMARERIYDPCFGVGRLLAACGRRAQDDARRHPPEVWRQIQESGLFGFEINPVAFAIGLARIILSGIDHPGLECSDALERVVKGERSADAFDCIVADPPVGVRVPVERTSHLPVKALSSETLFLQHVMLSLRPGGRAVMLLPEGALFRTGPDRAVREMLLERYCVEGVISLPANVFLPRTGVKFSVIAFRRGAPAETVRFMDVGDLTAERIPEIVRVFREEAPGDRVWEARRVELLARGAELVAKRSGDEPLVAALKRLRSADPSLPVRRLEEVADVQAGVSYDLKEATRDGTAPGIVAGLLRVGDVQGGATRPPTLFLSEETARGIRPDAWLRAGDVVVTVSGSVGKVAVVANGAVGAAATKSLVVVRPKEGISPHYLAAYLASEAVQAWLVGHARGATIQHLSPKTLRRLEVAVPDLALQDRIVRMYRAENEGANRVTAGSGSGEGAYGEARADGSGFGDGTGYGHGDGSGGGRGDGSGFGDERATLSSHRPGRGTDLSELLVRALTQSSDDPVARWLDVDGAVRDVVESGRIGRAQESRLPLLESLARSVADLRNRVAHEELATRPTLRIWLFRFHDAMVPLRSATGIPAGSPRLATIQSARQKMESLLGAHRDAPHPIVIDLFEGVRRILDDEASTAMNGYRVVATIEPSEVSLGEPTEVYVRVTNEGNVFVQNLQIDLEPAIGWKWKRSDYLFAGQTFTIVASLPPPSSLASIQIVVRWKAERVDGAPVSGELPLTIAVRPRASQEAAAEFGPSPYIVGSPVETGDMFFGRKDVLDRIRRQLATTHRANVILLEGNRRTGKTSILKQIEAPGALPGWIVVNCSLQGGEGHGNKAGLESREVFRLIAREVGLALHKAGSPVWLPDVPGPDPARSFPIQFARALGAYFETDRPFEAFDLYLKEVIEAISPRRLLIMLDEFDKLQEGIDSGVTSPQVPENIRYLFHTYPQVCGVLTGSRRLKRLREEYWSALFGFGHRIGLDPLDAASAGALVEQPVKDVLTFVPQARDRIVDLCAGQPFLIQALCNRIYERAAAARERLVTVEAVVSSADDMVQDNEHFRTLWGYAATERRRLILAMCQRASEREEPMTIPRIEKLLEVEGVQLPPGGELVGDIEFLRELELLRLETADGEQRYTLTVPLMSEWIRRNVDYQSQLRKAWREAEGEGDEDGPGRG